MNAVKGALTVIFHQRESAESLNFMGVSSLDTESQRVLETMTKTQYHPTPTPSGFTLSTPVGAGRKFAETIRSLMACRGIAVNVA